MRTRLGNLVDRLRQGVRNTVNRVRNAFNGNRNRNAASRGGGASTHS